MPIIEQPTQIQMMGPNGQPMMVTVTPTKQGQTPMMQTPM